MQRRDKAISTKSLLLAARQSEMSFSLLCEREDAQDNVYGPIVGHHLQLYRT